MNRDKVLDGINEVGSDSIGAAVSAGIGIAAAGPVGVIGGAVAGSIISNTFKIIGDEIRQRYLSKVTIHGLTVS